MVFGEFLTISLGNLWRMKLRSLLTVSGVIIGIAALVSIMSFGAGMQENVAQQFKSLELFSTLQIFPSYVNEDEGVDSALVKPLDEKAMHEIGLVPGVKSVFPEDTFPVRIEYEGKSVNATAQSLPASMADVSAFRELAAGRFFSSDSAWEIVLQKRMLDKLEVAEADSIIGKEVTLISAEVNLPQAFQGFVSGRQTNPFSENRYTFKVCGVSEVPGGMGFTVKNIMIPAKTAESISRLSFASPFELLEQLTGSSEEGYSLLTVRMESSDCFDSARDSIEALGYRTFSFADEFEDVKEVFLIFDVILGAVGFIALVVASLGIANTMIMSIIERYHEIGIMKSLGAENGHIRLQFLIETSVIGAIGAAIGILFGWLITRIGSVIAKYMMVKEGAPAIELFALPLWLVVLALLFGLAVSLAAGLYPADALRHE